MRHKFFSIVHTSVSLILITNKDVFFLMRKAEVTSWYFSLPQCCLSCYTSEPSWFCLRITHRAVDSFSNPGVLVVIDCLSLFLSSFLNPQIPGVLWHPQHPGPATYLQRCLRPSFVNAPYLHIRKWDGNHFTVMRFDKV